MGTRKPRIALAIPTVELGAYWKPVLRLLDDACDELRLFTAMPWRGVTDDELHPQGFIQVVGQKRRVTGSGDADSDYGGGVMVLSPTIALALWRLRPDVVIVSGFSLWTMIALALRPLARWRVVLLWEGSSPRVDFRDSPKRTAQRRLLARLADSILTNSPGGRDYLVEHLGLAPGLITQTPYMVPDPATLAGGSAAASPHGKVSVLSVGRWEERKGIVPLLQAVAELPAELRDCVVVRLIGAGPQEAEIDAMIAAEGLDGQVEKVGWVPYAELGAHLAAADVLAFLTYEDTWGMVALEAMSVGTAVLCSRWAGAHVLTEPEMVVDPHDVPLTTAALAALVSNPERIADAGESAAARMAQHRPVDAARRLMAAARRAALPR